MRIIGDVHGKYEQYLNLVQDKDCSVQVGDFGFRYECLAVAGLRPDLHRIIGGNHDNYEIIGQVPHYLGDYGRANVAGVDFFFIRGERSVDAYHRIEGRNWWRNEELDMPQGYAAIKAYAAAKPELVITHGCPADILQHVVTNTQKYAPSRTSQLLNAMFEAHRPKLWVFGHHHTSQRLKVSGTEFICLDELEAIDL